MPRHCRSPAMCHSPSTRRRCSSRISSAMFLLKCAGRNGCGETVLSSGIQAQSLRHSGVGRERFPPALAIDGKQLTFRSSRTTKSSGDMRRCSRFPPGRRRFHKPACPRRQRREEFRRRLLVQISRLFGVRRSRAGSHSRSYGAAAVLTLRSLRRSATRARRLPRLRAVVSSASTGCREPSVPARVPGP